MERRIPMDALMPDIHIAAWCTPLMLTSFGLRAVQWEIQAAAAVVPGCMIFPPCRRNPAGQGKLIIREQTLSAVQFRRTILRQDLCGLTASRGFRHLIPTTHLP